MKALFHSVFHEHVENFGRKTGCAMKKTVRARKSRPLGRLRQRKMD
jgi:hypothetical protein